MDRTRGGSRLLQMQARFQQKQMQEREQKIASLYEAQQARALDRVRHSPGAGARAVAGRGLQSGVTEPAPPPVPVHPGKVRQMFEERRTKAGIDKSYPLQPIHNTDRPAARKPLVKNGPAVNNGPRLAERKPAKTTTVRGTVRKTQQKIENNIISNGSGDLNHNHVQNPNLVKHGLPQSNGELVLQRDELDGDNNHLLEDETFPEALAPLPTPRSPEPVRPPRRSPTIRNSTEVKPQPVAPPRRVTSDKTVPDKSKARGAMQRSTLAQKGTSSPTPRLGSSDPRKRTEVSGPSASASASAGPGVACAVCGRRFAADRVARHEEICRRSNNAKRRKPFDALKHRLQGTEAEPLIGKIKKQQQTTSSTNQKPLNSTWRQKHQEFIAAIRAAKQVQAHISAGGKLSDLPPPPPSQNPDYIQCPHCNRRFNQAAAERHIPKCANYQYNKPKPNGKKR